MNNSILTKRDELYDKMLQFVERVRGGDIHGYCNETAINNYADAIIQEAAEIQILQGRE